MNSSPLLVASLIVFASSASAQGFADGPKLVGTGFSGNPKQGSSVALSADGSTALLGGPGDSSTQGATWVFTRTAGTWRQQGAKLVGTTAGLSQQGSAVALSSDGNTALVGGQGENLNEGAAWVFTRSGSTWSPQGSKLVGTGASGAAQQGISADLSADGNTAIVGGWADGSGAGAAWVFTRTGGVWSQQGAKLVGTGVVEGAVAQQGWSVALSANGDTALVGGFADFTAGATWVFTRSGGVWSQQGDKLVGTGASGAAQQGLAVALSGDGSTALATGPKDSSSFGASWVYARSGAVWTQLGGKLIGQGAGAIGSPQQGTSVAVSADGGTVLVGGPFDSASVGAGWIFSTSCVAGDSNGDGVVNVSDVLFLINFLFAGGPSPASCS